MAHKKAGTTTRLGRDSQSQRLGLKLSAGQWAKSGNILVRQRGTKWHPGTNVMRGSDDTLFAITSGFVKFTRRKQRRFDGKMNMRTFVHVVAKEKDVRSKL